MADLDELLGGNEDERDPRQQGGYRITLPGTGQDTGTGERMPAYATPATGPRQQVAEVQPPAIGDLLRGNPNPASAGAPPSAPPPMGRPPALPPGIVREPSPADVPAPPTGANNQRRMDLLKQMGGLTKPTDPKAVDPQTGKPMYRMSLGQRILGTVANFGQGFAREGGPTTYVGPGATNSRFAQTEGMREKTLGGVKEELGEQEKLDTTENKIYEDAIRQAYDTKLGDYREKLGSAADLNSQTRGQLATTTEELNRTKGDLNEAKAGRLEDPIGQRIKEADRMGLKGEERKQYLANGKLKEGSDRAPTDLEEWTAAFKRDNGRPPTAEEIANRKSRTSSKGDEIEKDKDKALKDAEDKAQKRIDKAAKDMFVLDQNTSTNPRFAAAKQAIYADLEKEKAQAQTNYEARARQNAPTRPAAAPARPAAAPARPTAPAPTLAPAKPATPANAPKIGQAVTVKGKQYTVGKVYPDGSWDPK